jgi:hypothetical protein
MDPMTAFLLSMQAAGMVTSLFGAKSQQKNIQIGRKLEQEQYTTNLQAIRLQSAESSLDEMKQLRQNIGTQIVTQAAKGNRGGSSYSGIKQSVGNFDSDERTRRMNLLAKESELRANHVLSGLHSAQSETELGQSLTKSLLNTVQTSTLLGQFGNKKPEGAQNKWVNPDNFSWGY